MTLAIGYLAVCRCSLALSQNEGAPRHYYKKHHGLCRGASYNSNQQPLITKTAYI